MAKGRDPGADALLALRLKDSVRGEADADPYADTVVAVQPRGLERKPPRRRSLDELRRLSDQIRRSRLANLPDDD